MAAKYPSSTDQDILSSQNEVQLCSLDQQNPGSCAVPSCYNLHMCRDYLLKNKCSEFELIGKCLYSHSLFTRQNQKVLEKRLHLSAKDGDAFDKVSQLIRTSISNSSEKLSSRPSHVDDNPEVESLDNQTSTTYNGRGRGQSSTLPRGSSVHLRKISSDHPGAERSLISPRLSLLTNSDYSQKSQSNSDRFSNSLDLDAPDRRRDRRRDDEPKSSTMHSLGAYDTDQNNNTSSTAASSFQPGKLIKSAVRSVMSMAKDMMPTKPDPNDTVRTDPQLKYIFDKFDRDDELSYLHGPTRRRLLDKGYQIFPSGYCRLVDANQEKQIETKLNTILPKRLKTDCVQLPNDDLAFFICASAAERILEQNQITYSIISEPYSAPLSIEVIRLPNENGRRSSSVPSRRIISTRLPNDQETPRLSTPDNKLRIPKTNSSIDVIRGDITSVQVDLMVCVTTSVTLVNSVLKKAGPSVISEFGRRRSASKPALLNGGDTSAQKILFLPWELEVDPSDSTRAQKSLSDLVKRCIDEARQLNMTSIAFPSIGTGKIGLDPDKVSESMINAACECLTNYTMNVLFVIHSSSKSDDPNEQCYRVFRNYLNDLCKDSRPVKAEASSIAHSPRDLTISIDRSQQIPRDVECKRISTVSDSSDMTFDHRQLLQSLERLLVEKTFDLSHVQQPFLDQVESLIDLCLDYHVIPRIDFGKGNLTLRGDPDSCSQCCFNLQKQRRIYKYFIYKKTAKKPEEIYLNMYVSIKIDEAFANDESNIRIEDGGKTVFHIDLHNSKIQINHDVQQHELRREHLNADAKIVLPSSWSSPLMIRKIDTSLSSSDSKKCLRLFQRTMPSAQWHVERIDAIENWPLYVHYNSTKTKDEIFAFHGCSYSSVQSIVHYGLHSNFGQSSENSIHLTYDAFDSHIQNARRSTDGKYYMFIVQLSEKLPNKRSTKLSNDTAHLALPTHLIVYRRQIVPS